MLEKMRSNNLEQVLQSVLHEREYAKLKNLLAVRGDSDLAKIISNLVKVVPNSVKRVHQIPDHVIDDIADVARDERYIRLSLSSGLTLYTFPSRQQYRNYYFCFRDALPKSLTPESYQAAHDVTFRLNAGDQMISDLKRRGFIADSNDLNIIECGAYNGWKALGFSRHTVDGGRVVVLEIDDDQFTVCQRNLATNLPANRYRAYHAGIWHSVEEREYSYEHYASHSLTRPDEHLHHTQSKKIRTETLDNIIEKSGVETYDFLNIQTGGAELEAMQGLVKHLDAVKVMWAGSHYKHDNISIRYRGMKYALEHGCRVYFDNLNREKLDNLYEITKVDDIKPEDTGGFWAVTPKWRDKIVPYNVANW